MSKIIQIEPTVDAFTITWTIQLRCNYDCMYCGDIRHEYKKGSMPDLEEMQNYWTQVYEKTKHLNKPYKLVISGGEPTINKNLLPMLEWLHTNYGKEIIQIGICTNGSASLSHYLKLFKYLNFIAFSTHTEFFDEEKFFETAIACNKFANADPEKSLMIKIMDEPWAPTSVNRFVNICKENNMHYDLCTNLNMDRKTRNYPIFKIKAYD